MPIADSRLGARFGRYVFGKSVVSGQMGPALAGQEHGRTIPLANIARSLNDLCLGPSPAAFQCARLSWYEPFPERLGGAMRRRKFINLNRFWNNPAATTLVLS